jgi:hypothetical protein
MLEVHLYGVLREIVCLSKASEHTILNIEARENEKFHQLIHRLGSKSADIGDCFINGNLASKFDIVKNGDRVGLFSFNMRLIDSGMELKYSPHRR